MTLLLKRVKELIYYKTLDGLIFTGKLHLKQKLHFSSDLSRISRDHFVTSFIMKC